MTAFFQTPIVVLANGRFPSNVIPLQILDEAGTVICTDGSADTLLQFERTPHVIIGDLDSTKLKKSDFKGLWIPDQDQYKTDLQKTLEWCLLNDLNEIAVLGAMGEREDHSLGNLHVLAEFSEKMTVHFITDFARIYCVKGQQTFQSKKGQQISIAAVEEVSSITTKGLKYALNNELFPPACNGISNEAEGDEFSINTSHPIWLFINHIE
ncbi:MAG TPA: thiamine diphosphokinase [Candidatus Marinimicrobia bacterium]|nr:thiamine diphosphokinase [Candidatus Neomarinimicrobiota bacterium]HIN19458.1 thiamine diphosphokinase [Candidatus Neomarinimicrobiota bacterium]